MVISVIIRLPKTATSARAASGPAGRVSRSVQAPYGNGPSSSNHVIGLAKFPGNNMFYEANNAPPNEPTRNASSYVT